MSVRFLLHTPPDHAEPVEYIHISSHDAKDVVSRRATDEDKAKYHAEYAAFKGPAAAHVATIALEPAPVSEPAPSEPTPETPKPKKRSLFR